MPKADMQPTQIRHLLSQKQMTFADVDRQHKLPTGTSRIGARRPQRNGEIAIAHELGIAPHVIWPTRYDAKGRRLRPQPRANYKPARQFRTVKNGMRSEQTGD